MILLTYSLLSYSVSVPLPYAQQAKKCGKVQGLHSSFFIHHYSLMITARRPMASKMSQKVDSSTHCHPSRGSAVR